MHWLWNIIKLTKSLIYFILPQANHSKSVNKTTFWKVFIDLNSNLVTTSYDWVLHFTHTQFYFFQLLHFIFNPLISIVFLFIILLLALLCLHCEGFDIAFLWDWNENWPFLVLGSLLSFPNLLLYWVQHFHSISFRIWNSSAGILSPPLALFLLMFPKAPLTLHSRKPGSRWVSIPSWLSGSLRFFLYSSSVYSCHLFLISSASVKSVPFCPLLCPSLHEMFPWYL